MPKHTPPQDVEALQAQIAELQKKLDASESGRETAEAQVREAKAAHAIAIQTGADEVPTGNTITVQKCVGYDVDGYHADGRQILKPKFEEEEVPTYLYKIDMPPLGGVDIKINGQSYQHGLTYTFDIYTLRQVKEIIYRLWAHDASVHGNDENAYRPKTNATFSGKTMGRVH